jgi:serine/threonine protein kinase
MWFFFTQRNLPASLSTLVKTKFLEVQSLVFADSKSHKLEHGKKHVHFSRNDPKPFQVFGLLGKGAHSSVDKLMSTLSQKEYARRRFRKTRWQKEDVQTFLTELRILKRVRNKHCVELVS